MAFRERPVRRPHWLAWVVAVALAVLATVAAALPVPHAAAGHADDQDQATVIELEPKLSDLRASMYRDVLHAATTAERRRLLYLRLKSVLRAAQGPVLDALHARNLNYTTLWLTNSVVVMNARPEDLADLRRLPTVLRIRLEAVVPLSSFMVDDISSADAVDDDGANWHLDAVHAREAWAHAVGTGVTVGVLDGGARFTHGALFTTYRGLHDDGRSLDHNYHWFDFVYGQRAPHDTLRGLGTQMIAVAAGAARAGVSVAPGARWMATNTCDRQYGCRERHIIQGIEFLLCPTDLRGRRRNCARGADVVLTAWAGLAGDASFRHLLYVWSLAGVVPVVGAGDAGPRCSTLSTPANSALALGVGATDRSGRLAAFSGRGPGLGVFAKYDAALFPTEKPDVVAPGAAVRTADVAADDAYIVASGTHLAAASVAGVVALVLSALPGAPFTTVHALLVASATPPTLATAECVPAGAQFNRTYTPTYGYGHVNAAGAVALAAPTAKQALAEDGDEGKSAKRRATDTGQPDSYS